MTLALIGKLLTLRRAEWRDLLAAQAALLHAQLLVWTRRRGAMPIHPAAPAGPPAPTPGDPVGRQSDAAVQRIGRAVARAARYGVFRPTCLVRALALQHLLQRRGFPDSALWIGVRRRDGALLAHAWVECRGTVLGDEEWRVRQFDELARVGGEGERIA